MSTKIAIIGGGNAGQALAADCKLGGAEVRLFEFEEYSKNIDTIRDTKKIELYGHEMNQKNFKRNGVAELDLITTDIKEAVKDAEIIGISVRAGGYDRMFKELIPHLEDGQIISLFPDNFGSLVFRKLMKEMGCTKDVVIGGWSSLPYGARLTQLGETNKVFLNYRAVSLRCDTMPSCDRDKFVEAMKNFPPADTIDIDFGDTIIDIGFSNVNPILHVPATIMNIGTIDNWGVIDRVGEKGVTYDIYQHGFSENVAKVQWEIYQEESAVAEAMGVGIQPYEKDVFFSRTSILGPEFMGEGFSIPFEVSIPDDEWMVFLPNERFTSESRYITEDIPVGCFVFSELAKKFGVDTPIINSMINLGSVISEKNYYESSFDLKYLGIADLNKVELNAYLREKTE